jgi:hypothetical protein
MRPSRGILAALVVAGAAGLAARTEAQEFNGLWWSTYNAFQPSPEVAPGLWWDHYQVPYRAVWNGPYYTVDHVEPYVPRTVASSFLIYNFADAAPQSSRPWAFYAPMTPGPITFPENATVFWRDIWPELLPETRALIGDQLGQGGQVAGRWDGIPALPPPRPKQYYRKSVLGPLRGTYWQEEEAPAHDRPGPRVIRGDHFGFTQYYRPPGQSRWVLRPTRRPKRVIEPAQERE